MSVLGHWKGRERRIASGADAALQRGRWDAMTPVEQFDYVVGIERALANSRGAVDLMREIGWGEVGFEDPPGLGRVVLRIDRATYYALRRLVAGQ